MRRKTKSRAPHPSEPADAANLTMQELESYELSEADDQGRRKSDIMAARRTRPVVDVATKYEAGWEWTQVSAAFRRRNPQCQAIIDGQQCLEFSKVAHHLVSPAV